VRAAVYLWQWQVSASLANINRHKWPAPKVQQRQQQQPAYVAPDGFLLIHALGNRYTRRHTWRNAAQPPNETIKRYIKQSMSGEVGAKRGSRGCGGAWRGAGATLKTLQPEATIASAAKLATVLHRQKNCHSYEFTNCFYDILGLKT